MKEKKSRKELKSKAEYNVGSRVPYYAVVVTITILACIGFTIFLGRFSLIQWGIIIACIVSIISYHTQTTFGGKCPHCNKDIWVDATAYVDGSKFNCPLCGKALKLSNQYFCVINEETSHDLSNSMSNLQQIKELKELLDLGAITQAEYETKKAELLNRK